ncbi:hypothetical protein KQI86_06785 [Clostridium sp. MSJ-11]|uniref:DUF5673 domain-containing protein n=1 Tax=Clostridium mobile TaxID=2841512 RepID=A0ABS6EH43_9CLOT|nr:hypothetical protein [Clostridium mobile]MBU5484031.1 hypothetical protein [Clostridium mobile]
MSITKEMQILIFGNILLFFCISTGTYEIITRGKLLLATDRKEHPTIMTGFVILISIVLFRNFIDYLKYKEIYWDELMKFILYLQIGIYNIIIKKHSLGIREGGISIGNDRVSTFYKWNKIKNHQWIDENKIKLKILGFRNSLVDIEFQVEDEQMEEAEELLERYIIKN